MWCGVVRADLEVVWMQGEVEEGEAVGTYEELADDGSDDEHHTSHEDGDPCDRLP